MGTSNHLSEEAVHALVEEHRGWAEGISRAVARAWRMDWQGDGMQSAALEALYFCARRFDPAQAVPFKGYARRRIHEAATEEARKSKAWQNGLVDTNSSRRKAKEISHKLLEVFPELRDGQLPFEGDPNDEGSTRASIRGMLMGASILAAKEGVTSTDMEEMMDYKRMVDVTCHLEPIHQMIVWKIYWEGYSLRSLADDWETDELNIIREHKVVLLFLQRSLSGALSKGVEPPKIRPALRGLALKFKKKDKNGPFSQVLVHERSG